MSLAQGCSCGQVGSGGLQALGAVGGGVAVSGGVDDRVGPVLGDLLVELVDALDPPLVGEVELFAPGLLGG